jgi:superfamily II DNA or RNA helicase
MDVHIEVGAIRLAITPYLPIEDMRALRKHLTYVMHNYQYTTQHKLYGWDGRRTLLYKNQTAPAGCIYRITKFLTEEFDHTVHTTYKNNYEPCGTPEIHGLELKKFQKKALKQILTYRRGIIQAPVRSGKTAIAAATIKQIGHFPAWVVTNGKDLVKQTQEDLAYHLQMPIGFFSESKYEPGKVMVTSYQAITRALAANEQTTKAKTYQRNLALHRQLQNAKVVIFDECHHALAPKNRILLNALISAGYVIGLSGTPKPDKADALELEAAIGTIIFKVNYSTLIKDGRIAQPMVIIYKLPYCWYTTGLRNFPYAYGANIVENMYRNRFIADIVKNLYKTNKTAFVMIRNVRHGPILRALIPDSVFVKGAVSSAVRKELYKSLNEKEIRCIIATVGKEGLNIKGLDAVINAEGYKSSVTTMQKLRSLTAIKEKKYGYIIDFIDRGKYLRAHSNRRIRLYKQMGKIKLKIKQTPKDLYPMENS